MLSESENDSDDDEVYAKQRRAKWLMIVIISATILIPIFGIDKYFCNGNDDDYDYKFTTITGRRFAKPVDFIRNQIQLWPQLMSHYKYN